VDFFAILLIPSLITSYTARWAKFGSENTLIFNSMTTIRYRKNSISSLAKDDGSVTFDHHEKAGIL
jgi:hypothetical protein